MALARATQGAPMRRLDTALLAAYLFAMAFAGLMLSVLRSQGWIRQTNIVGQGYTQWGVLEDVRSILSFVMAAFFCLYRDNDKCNPLDLIMTTASAIGGLPAGNFFACIL